MSGKHVTGIKVFLIDDHPAVRQGLALLLAQAGHEVCGEAQSREEAVGRVGGSGAQVALLDLSLGEASGLDALEDLAARDIPVVVYSMHEDRATIERAFALGAHGYVTKREVSDVLLEALGHVVARRRYASPRAAQSLASRVLSPVGGETALSQREEQILALLGRGETSAEIAGALHISIRTVETYYARIIEKLGLAGTRELRKHAIRLHREIH